MFANLFFFKRFKATVHRVAHPSKLKQGLQILRVCCDLASNPLTILGTLRIGLGDRWHIADGTEKTRQNLPAVVYRAKPLGATVGI
jgi:hypothetical protein